MTRKGKGKGSQDGDSTQGDLLDTDGPDAEAASAESPPESDAHEPEEQLDAAVGHHEPEVRPVGARAHVRRTDLGGLIRSEPEHGNARVQGLGEVVPHHLGPEHSVRR